MHYYDVWVRSERYRGKKALTYASAQLLPVGAVVRVPLQRETAAGIVVGKTSKPPKVTVKPIEYHYPFSPLPTPLLRLGRWLAEYYRTPLGAVTQTLIPAHLPIRKTSFSLPESAPNPKPATLPPLTPEQQQALQVIGNEGSYVIHGRTGSGKTRLYLELAQRMLATGRSVVILTPEISLTSQLEKNFADLGTSAVVVMHSEMTAKARYEAWRLLLERKTPQIVIGARSALFAPIANIGLVVVDESHEPSYKQEQEPRYHANRAAATLAHLHKAVLLYGSATPAVAEYYLAQQAKAPILRLQKTAINHNVDTSTTIIDIKERDQYSKSAIFSDALIGAMGRSLNAKEQVLLYLNRRGTARISLCQHCGWQATCPHCGLPLTYHGDSHKLRCHSCDHVEPATASCPICGHTDLSFRGVGTKAVVDEARRFFPEARIVRFDSDTGGADRFEKHYSTIREGGADIIVGTQSLAKGLDLPLLSTVGIILADTSLSMPDYTATERTYQLLAQVSGRIGRGHRAATLVMQTYMPDNTLLQDALEDNWEHFYNNELAQRQLYAFPPFRHLLLIRCRRASAASAEKACQKIIELLSTAPFAQDIEIDGPTPAFHEKTARGFTWQLVVKSRQRSQLLAAVDALPATVTSYDLDPATLL